MGGPRPIEAPRVAGRLEPFTGEGLEDGDVVEAVHWSEGGWAGDDVQELQIESSRLSAVRLTGIEIDDLTLIDTVVETCELSGAVVADLRCERVVFDGCRLAGLTAAGLRARHVRFVGCQLTEAWLRGAVFEHCELVDCDLAGADLTGARFTGSRLVRCGLDHAELSDVKADELALHGSTMVETRGLASLQHLVIASDQIVDVAVPLLAARGIRVDDEYLVPPDAGG
jgi:hypothetical protein